MSVSARASARKQTKDSSRQAEDIDHIEQILKNDASERNISRQAKAVRLESGYLNSIYRDCISAIQQARKTS